MNLFDIRVYEKAEMQGKASIRKYLQKIARQIRIINPKELNKILPSVSENSKEVSYDNIARIMKMLMEKDEIQEHRKKNNKPPLQAPKRGGIVEWFKEDSSDNKLPEKKSLDNNLNILVTEGIRSYLNKLLMIDRVMNKTKNNTFYQDFEPSDYEITSARICSEGFNDQEGKEVDLIGQWAIFSELAIRLEVELTTGDIDFYFACTPWKDEGHLYAELLMKKDEEEGKSPSSKQPNFWHMLERINPDDSHSKLFYPYFLGFNNYIDFNMRINAELRMPWMYHKEIYPQLIGMSVLEYLSHTGLKKKPENKEVMTLMGGTLEPRTLWKTKIETFNKAYGETLTARYYSNESIREDNQRVGGWRRLLIDGNSDYGYSRDKYIDLIEEKLPKKDIKKMNDIIMYPYTADFYDTFYFTDEMEKKRALKKNNTGKNS